MKKTMTMALCLTVITLLAACKKGGQTPAKNATDTTGATTLTPEYAKGFSVRQLDNGIRLVDVADPQTDEDRMPVDYHFALVPHDLTGAEVPEGYTPVSVPLSRTIVMTMLQLADFTALDALDVVKGITGTKNLYNTDVKRMVKQGDIVKIGMEGNFDTELILKARPDVIFISPFKRGGYDVIKETGIQLIPHLGYKELHPLGQAEWLKFVGMFIGKERQADSLFNDIKRSYNELKAKVAEQHYEQLPTVFSGEMHGGNWYAVGGKNSLAQIFRDAGASYVIDNDDTGGTNIEFEQMYAAAAKADFWRILNSYEGDFSYDALEASEPRNTLFKAFRERKVIYCNMKQTPYYEKSPVMPHALLADLVAIFHPELLPDHQPTFYRLLP